MHAQWGQAVGVGVVDVHARAADAAGRVAVGVGRQIRGCG